jgi:hypothetical protein
MKRHKQKDMSPKQLLAHGNCRTCGVVALLRSMAEESDKMIPLILQAVLHECAGHIEAARLITYTRLLNLKDKKE